MKKLKIIFCLLMAIISFTKVFAGGGKAPGTLKHIQAPDKALLAKFELLCKKISNTKGNYTIDGVININDKASPADKMSNVRFLFCKQGDEFYYRLGNTTTINEDGVYLYIDYQTKRILVSQKKQVIYDMGLKQLGDIGANIQSENYKMSSKVKGDEQTISLINEHHISCKQYAITFARHSMNIKRLYMRLSNFNDPLRTDNEKIVDVSINQWDNTADITKYLTKNKVIKNVNGEWKAVDEYKNYQLIKM